MKKSNTSAPKSNKVVNNKTPQKAKSKKKSGSKGRTIFWALFFTCAIGVFLGMGVYVFVLLSGEKLLKENENRYEKMAESSIIYNSAGEEIAKLYSRENREIATSDEIPAKVRNAFIATEDHRFNEHQGIDLWGIGRAIVKDILTRSAKEGGSTITQQLAKNLFLNPEKTFFRKATEIAIALALERHHTKDEIMVMYLNRIFFGQGAHGIKAAAKRYFGISDLDKLEPWQLATLASLPKAPSRFNPITNPELSKQKRAIVLNSMKELNFITEEEYQTAIKVDYTYKKEDVTPQNEAYWTFLDYALKEASNKTGKDEEELLSGGYKIYTTMNSYAQKVMHEEYQKEENFDKSVDEQKIQSSMVIYDHHTGSIIAMIGGRDYVRKGLNRAITKRQPGSAFKPIVSFGPALETGRWFPWSTVKDEEKCYAGYCPKDLGRNKYVGDMTMKEALRKSTNQPPVWLLNEIGVKTGFQFAKRLGIDMDSGDRNLTIALGGLTRGASPLEMVRAYGAFGNNGKMYQPYSISKIEDKTGKIVYEYYGTKFEQVMKPQTAYYMTTMLQDVVNSGTGRKAKLSSRPLAGKTGTAQHGIKNFNGKNDRDIWFVGYTPEWTGAIWVGYDKTDRKHLVKSGSGAANLLFKAVMDKALAKHTNKREFSKPKGIEKMEKPPSSLDLSGSFAQDQQVVNLNWGKLKLEGSASQTVNYKVYRKTGDEEPQEIMNLTDETSAQDKNVSEGKTYQYYVVPSVSSMNMSGPKSNVITIKVEVKEVVPEPPVQTEPEIPPLEDFSSETESEAPIEGNVIEEPTQTIPNEEETLPSSSSTEGE